MATIGRNDPCPCGSGEKFKKCHMGRENELALNGQGEITEVKSAMITHLPEVSYGRSQELAKTLNIHELTGRSVGIRFVDLKKYSDVNISGSARYKVSKEKRGGVFINPHKTMKTDPAHVYLAISPGIDDSTLAHQMAHVLDYLAGSLNMPGILQPIGLEMEIPIDHLEHTVEFGYWLDYLKKKLEVQLDADDSIICYLYEKGMLIGGKDIIEGNRIVLKAKSNRIFQFLSENSQYINTLIRNLPGYIAPRKAND